MNRIASFAAGLFVFSGLVFAAACSEDTPVSNNPPTDGGGEGGGGGTPLGEPAVPCADAQDAIYGDPGALSGDKGAVLKCNKAGDVSKETIQARLTALKYAGKPITSGARVYRVAYKTERGDDKNTAGFSSAIVFVPT